MARTQTEDETMEVRWGRANQRGVEGIRITFVFDNCVDEFEFFDRLDIECVMNLLTKPTVVPEVLLMVIRDRLHLTVH